MYAVFFMSGDPCFSFLKDQTVYLFDSKESANRFVFESLKRAELIIDLLTHFEVEGETFNTSEEAIIAAQNTFYALEFLHCYDVSDNRQKNGA